jgi:hypothetical protein
MKRICIILYMLPTLLFSQAKADYVWLNGGQRLPDQSGIRGHIMNFNDLKEEPIEGIMRYGFWSMNSSVSDEDGNLLFFTNGCSVMNRNFEVMPNGDGINSGNYFDDFIGDCIYGHPGFQSALILPDPGNSDGYYVIHIPANFENGQLSFNLSYSYVDMRLEEGKGDVKFKNISLYENNDIMNCYITAISESNNEGWWLIHPIRGDRFISFFIGMDSIKRYPDQASFHEFIQGRTSSAGTARFSPNGDRYALYSFRDQLHVYDFDRATGQLSNHQKVELFTEEEIENSPVLFTSVEWSPSGRFLYCSNMNHLYQIDTWESDLHDGIRHIDEYNGTLDPFPTRLFLMVQAPDCKIYMAPKNGSYSMHVINKPDELGKDCDFVQNAIKLPNAMPGTLPNFPRYRVDEEEKCDPGLSSVMGDQVLYRQPLKVYPNPSHGQYMVQIPETVQRGRLVVMDLMGRPVFTREIHYSLLQEIDISHLSAGHYHVSLYPMDMSERVYYGGQVVKL